jgi:anti-sigma regulatory factor (Ser/Thr protein kinase)
MPENSGSGNGESWEYSLSIPNDLRAVTVSRRTLRLILTLHGLISLVDTAELVAAELIGNAVQHTAGPAALRVRYAGGVLRIGAWDTDPEPPEPPDTPDLQLAEDDRGLLLVRACADHWGWHALPRHGNRGKYIWCELTTGTPVVA